MATKNEWPSVMRHHLRLKVSVCMTALLSGAPISAHATDVGTREHVVRKGETLSAIARRYGVAVSNLVQSNGVRDPNLIRTGTSLRVPTSPSGASALPEQSQQTSPPPPRTGQAAGQVRMRPPPPEVQAEIEAQREAQRRDAQIRQETLRASLDVIVDGRRYPAAEAEASTVELIQVSPSGLANSLAALLNDETLAALRALGPGLRSPADLGALGLVTRLDPGSIAITTSVPPELRRTMRLSGITLEDYPGAREVEPARLAAGVTTALTAFDTLDDDADAVTQLAFSGFFNIGGLQGLNLDYSGLAQWSESGDTFQRGAITAFIDRPDQAMRYSFGDVSPLSTGFVTSAPLLGVSVERSYTDFQPNRIIRPTGQRRFVLERPATIEVYSNGVLLSRFAAQPGPIDLTDIAVAGVRNQVTVVVEDALGRRELDQFSLASDVNLLAQGINEFILSAGVKRDSTTTGFEYTDEWVVTGEYTAGVSDRLTLGGGFSASEDLQAVNGTVAGVVAAGVGVVTFAASESPVGSGYAAGLAYRSDSLFLQERGDSLTTRVTYFSPRFSTLLDPTSLDDIEWDVGAEYQAQVTDRTSVSLGVSYLSTHRLDDADRFVTAGVSHAIGPWRFNASGRFGETATGESEQAVFFSIGRALGFRDRATVSYDTDRRLTRAELVRTRQLEVPDVTYRLTAEEQRGRQSATGQIGYYASRFEVDASVDSVIRSDGILAEQERVAVRIQSGIGYADGTFAIGRDPGRGFFMVRPHRSLEGARVELQQGRIGGLSLADGTAALPALAPTTTPYRPTELSVAVLNPPEGYDVGDTRFVTLPGARTGVVLDVGGDAYRTRVENRKVEGRPVSLAFGDLVNLQTGEVTSFFTNREGRASFNALSQGSYEIQFKSLNARYRFDVIGGQAIYMNLGVIDMELLP
jgi:outer membrane usher protein